MTALNKIATALATMIKALGLSVCGLICLSPRCITARIINDVRLGVSGLKNCIKFAKNVAVEGFL